mmetsp:Transcript_32295/g.77425  ORF Transcript_32295/g.77425 Transcript_32295/m.77425 type:complete len:346 (+) Transcript_32295:32-1069(+)
MSAVTIVTGFLGAGKSTLLRRLMLACPGAQLVNSEVGPAAIPEFEDAKVVYELGGDRLCSDLVYPRLSQVAQRNPGAPIFLETSGLASPAVLVESLQGCKDDKLVLQAVIVVVDCTLVCRYLTPGHAVNSLLEQQLRLADIVVLSKTDLSTADAAHNARVAIAGINETVRVVIGHRGELEDLEEVLGAKKEAIASSEELWQPLKNGFQTHVLVGPYPLRKFSPSVNESAMLAYFANFIAAPPPADPDRPAVVLRVKAVLIEGTQTKILHATETFSEITVSGQVVDEDSVNKIVVIGSNVDVTALCKALGKLLLKPAPDAVFTMVDTATEIRSRGTSPAARNPDSE